MNLEVDIIDNPNELYTAAVEYLVPARNTRAEAEQEAADLVRFVQEARNGENALRLEKERQQFEKEQADAIARAADDERHRKERARRRLWSNIGWATLYTTIIALILALSFAWYRSFANDYAGMDQRSLNERVYKNLTAWYGLNEVDKAQNVIIARKEKSQFNGQEAWKVTLNMGDGTTRTAYITSDSASTKATFQIMPVK